MVSWTGEPYQESVVQAGLFLLVFVVRGTLLRRTARDSACPPGAQKYHFTSLRSKTTEGQQGRPPAACRKGSKYERGYSEGGRSARTRS